MPTPFESAQLILTLFDQRREAMMREARNYFTRFDPQSFEEFMAGMMGPHSGHIRMVISYWDMAASLVNNGAIDQKMFVDASGEFIFVFGKMEPLLPQIREAFGNPDFLGHLERLTLGIPNGRQRVDETVKRMRQLMEASKAASKPSA